MAHLDLMKVILDHALSLDIDTATLPTHPQIGKFYYAPVIGKPRSNRSGRIKLLADGVAFLMNMITGEKTTVFAHLPATEAERKKWQAEAKKAQTQAKREQEKAYQERALVARSKWFDVAKPVNNNHPYLQKKRLKPVGVKQLDDCLVVPIYSFKTGKIESLQSISPVGQKQFMTGGRIGGNFFAGRKFDRQRDSKVIISEGWATSQSLIQHWHVQAWHVACFSAGNILAVAKTIRKMHPNIEIIIAGDNDVSGVGQTKALETAKAIGGKVSIPQFTDEERAKYPKCSDWLDRHLIDQQNRLNAVKEVRYVG